MLSLTRKTDFALVAMAELAWLGAARASARKISERTGVPLPVLTNILHRLGIAGLVQSHLGAKGGYGLAKAAARMNITEIIEAIEGPFRLTICNGEAEGSSSEHACDLEANCRIKVPMQRLQQKMREFLCNVTLESMLGGSGPIGIGLEQLRGSARSVATGSDDTSGHDTNGDDTNGNGIEKGCLHVGAGGMK